MRQLDFITKRFINNYINNNCKDITTGNRMNEKIELSGSFVISLQLDDENVENNLCPTFVNVSVYLKDTDNNKWNFYNYNLNLLN